MNDLVDVIAVALPILAVLDWLAVRAFIQQARKENLMDEPAARFQLISFLGANVLATGAALLGVQHFHPFLPPGAPLALIVGLALGVSIPQLVWWGLSMWGRFR